MTQAHRPRPTIQIVITLVSAVSLLAIVWSAWVIVVQPDLGVLWTDRGDVYFAKPQAPIQVGDRLVTIDGLPLSQSGFPYYHWEKGDIVRIGLERRGDEHFPGDSICRPGTAGYIGITPFHHGCCVGVVGYQYRRRLVFTFGGQTKPAIFFVVPDVSRQSGAWQHNKPVLERSFFSCIDLVGRRFCYSFSFALPYQPY